METKIRVLVTGGRYIDNRKLINEVMNDFFARNPRGILIHGTTPFEIYCGSLAKKAGYEVIECKADWHTYKSYATMMLNREMVRKYRPDIIIAFIGREATTNVHDMIGHAMSKGIHLETHIL